MACRRRSRWKRSRSPRPATDKVLIKVRATSVNPAEWYGVTGQPYADSPVRAASARPKTIACRIRHVAGTVEAVGANVTQFKPGDEVFGGVHGALAEYVVAREQGAIVAKPAEHVVRGSRRHADRRHHRAAGAARSGHIAAGQKVLINGASGGVGTYAVQIAKSFGAEVTARVQHAQRGDGAFARRGSRHRLHQGELHRGQRSATTSSSTTSAIRASSTWRT